MSPPIEEAGENLHADYCVSVGSRNGRHGVRVTEFTRMWVGGNLSSACEKIVKLYLSQISASTSSLFNFPNYDF